MIVLYKADYEDKSDKEVKYCLLITIRKINSHSREIILLASCLLQFSKERIMPYYLTERI